MAKTQFRSRRKPKEVKEFQEEVLDIARVTRVVKGGRRLRFRATVIIGNRKGKVGVGTGKSVEVAAAIQKAIANAKRELIVVPLTKIDSIPHEVKLKFKAARLMIMPAFEGTGIIAGGAVRKIAELAGVKNMYGKSFGTTNKLVSAQATIKALEELKQVRAEDKKVFETKKPQEQKFVKGARKEGTFKRNNTPKNVKPVVKKEAK